MLARGLLNLATKSTFKSAVRGFSVIKFSPSHEYVRLDGDIGVVGITEHAASALGDVVFVDLPNVGNKYGAGDSFGSVESVKAASDVYAPIAGEVLAVNNELDSTPGKVNEAPLGAGWFIKLKVSAAGKADFDKLLTEEQYAKLLEDEAH